MGNNKVISTLLKMKTENCNNKESAKSYSNLIANSLTIN